MEPLPAPCTIGCKRLPERVCRETDREEIIRDLFVGKTVKAFIARQPLGAPFGLPLDPYVYCSCKVAREARKHGLTHENFPGEIGIFPMFYKGTLDDVAAYEEAREKGDPNVAPPEFF